MGIELDETQKHVLLDTQVFDAYRKDFQRADFATLEKLVDEARASVFISSVIDGEVQRHLTEDSEEAQRVLRKTLKDNSILQHHPKVPFHELTRAGALDD